RKDLGTDRLSVADEGSVLIAAGEQFPIAKMGEEHRGLTGISDDVVVGNDEPAAGVDERAGAADGRAVALGYDDPGSAAEGPLINLFAGDFGLSERETGKPAGDSS